MCGVTARDSSKFMAMTLIVLKARPEHKSRCQNEDSMTDIDIKHKVLTWYSYWSRSEIATLDSASQLSDLDMNRMDFMRMRMSRHVHLSLGSKGHSRSKKMKAKKINCG